jgi:hypothetical protein
MINSMPYSASLEWSHLLGEDSFGLNVKRYERDQAQKISLFFGFLCGSPLFSVSWYDQIRRHADGVWDAEFR